MSHDMEDIIAVLDGRPELHGEIAQASDNLRQHLVGRFQALLGDFCFREALFGHMPCDKASQARVPIILARIQHIAEI